MWWSASLGPSAHQTWPRGSADLAADVKPFVRRQKNDAIDAEAICEAAQRPIMRFVAAKSEQQSKRWVQFAGSPLRP
jgi:transposase